VPKLLTLNTFLIKSMEISTQEGKRGREETQALQGSKVRCLERCYDSHRSVLRGCMDCAVRFEIII
jgi:hypothetical protein